MVTLKEDLFGTFNNESIRRFTWMTTNGVSVSVISYGATITSVVVPDVYGTPADVVLGFDDMAGYRKPENPYFGATVGRCANRIASGKFTIDGVEYNLAKNVGQNHLHGGLVGFDKVNWNAHVEGTKVIFSYLSRDLEEGYPGDLVATVSYELLPNDTLSLIFQATTTKSTVVNLTNHSYFNLASHDGGVATLADHVVSINADRITDTDEDSIPTGEFTNVGGTPFDLRIPTRLGDALPNVGLGFDDNFCITMGIDQNLSFVSRVAHPISGRYLEVYSDQPGVQFYTANYLPSPDQPALAGKGGGGYRKHGALCLETQNYPNAVNHASFPSPLLVPGQVYSHRVKYVFGNTGDARPFVSFK